MLGLWNNKKVSCMKSWTQTKIRLEARMSQTSVMHKSLILFRNKIQFTMNWIKLLVSLQVDILNYKVKVKYNKIVIPVKAALYANLDFLQIDIFYYNRHEELIFSVHFVPRPSEMELVLRTLYHFEFCMFWNQLIAENLHLIEVSIYHDNNQI